MLLGRLLLLPGHLRVLLGQLLRRLGESLQLHEDRQGIFPSAHIEDRRLEEVVDRGGVEIDDLQGKISLPARFHVTGQVRHVVAVQVPIVVGPAPHELVGFLRSFVRFMFQGELGDHHRPMSF